ncbi:MAG: hypothetical protein R3B12_01260 [Candidatus Saccharimonadales bacterium]
MAGNFVVNTDKLVVSTTTGNTAIGTTDTSTYKLNVGGTGNFSGQTRISLDNDVTTTDATGSLIVGVQGANNIGIDGNEIMARNNGTAATLYLQNEGGSIQTGASFTQSGATTFSTGTGTNTLNGATTLASTLQVNGNTTLGDANTDTTTVRGLTTLSDSSSTYPLRFGADVDLYRGAADRLDLATGDSLNLVSGNIQQNGTNRLTTAGLFQAADGAVGGPSYSFSNSTNMGMYRIDANNLGFSVGGTERLRVTNTGASVTGNLGVSGSTTLKTVNQGYSANERYYPNVISYTQDATVSGAWVIHTPIDRSSNHMSRIRVHGYLYGNSANIDFYITVYSYSGCNGNVDGLAGCATNYGLEDLGNDGLSKYVGIDANGKLTVAFGDTGTSIYFGRVSVDAWITRTAVDYSSGWSIDLSTTAGFGWKDSRAH